MRAHGAVDQYCTNGDCHQKKHAAFAHFASREAMNIEGLSDENLTLFMRKKLVFDLPSIMALDTKYSEILALERFQKRAAKKLVQSVKAAKEVRLERFLFALGIRHIGLKKAALIAQRFGTIANIIKAKISDLELIREVGPRVAQSLVTFFHNPLNQQMVNRFLTHGVVIKAPLASTSTRLAGQTFVLTGELSQPRETFKRIIETHSGSVTTALSARTSYLLVGKGAGSKFAKAKNLGTKIISEEDFVKLVKG